MRRAIYAFIAITMLAFAGGFPAYLAMGQGGGGPPTTVSVIVSAIATPVVAPPPPPPPPGGGGGGGGKAEGTLCPAGEVSCIEKTAMNGRVLITIVVKSLDERFELTIDKGIVALAYSGSPLGCIGIHLTEGSPSPPEDAYLIGIMYDAVPDRATFFLPATIKYSYDPTSIPEGVLEDRLVIASYDKASGKWTALDSVVDTEANTITAQISRFNDLAVFGYMEEAPPPAVFQISSLSISPATIYSGEAVTITMMIDNTGGQSASYQVALKINGAAEASKEVTLDAGTSEGVSFTTSRGTAGTYSVDVNGITGTFEVKPRPVIPPPAHFNWWLIALGVVAAALAALLTHAFRVQKKYGGVTGVLAMEAGKVVSLAPKLLPKVMAAASSLVAIVSSLAPKVMAAVRSLLRQFSKLIKKK